MAVTVLEQAKRPRGLPTATKKGAVRDRHKKPDLSGGRLERRYTGRGRGSSLPRSIESAGGAHRDRRRGLVEVHEMSSAAERSVGGVKLSAQKGVKQVSVIASESLHKVSTASSQATNMGMRLERRCLLTS